jgi:hypothetical protein
MPVELFVWTRWDDQPGAFWVGLLVGALAAFLLIYALVFYEKWRGDIENFRAWKKVQGKAPEVVDAQFVISRPRPGNSPQLNSSAAMVRRTTHVTRRQQ